MEQEFVQTNCSRQLIPETENSSTTCSSNLQECIDGLVLKILLLSLEGWFLLDFVLLAIIILLISKITYQHTRTITSKFICVCVHTHNDYHTTCTSILKCKENRRKEIYLEGGWSKWSKQYTLSQSSRTVASFLRIYSKSARGSSLPEDSTEVCDKNLK